MNITPIYGGTFSVGLDKKFHPIPREGKAAKGALKVSINPFLIRYPDRLVLIDPGLGEFGIDTPGNRIVEALDEMDVSDYDITDIVCSHLHYDHIGGLARRNSGYWELNYPEARVWVSEQEWDKALRLPVYYDEEKTEFLAFVNARANMNFLAASDSPFEGLSVTTIGGHTEFSLLIEGQTGDDHFLMAGDVLASRSHANRKFAAKYDYDPRVAQQRREEITDRAYKSGAWILAYHSNSGPVFRLSNYDERTGYTLSDPE